MRPLRPLHWHLGRILFYVMVLAFVTSAVIVGSYQYGEGQKDAARILESQLTIAKSLIPSFLLAQDNRFQSLVDVFAGMDDEEVLGNIRDARRWLDPFDICYVLNEKGKIVKITDGYKNYLGFNPSHMNHIVDKRKVSRVFQSIFSKHSVVALKYRLNENLLLIYERDISNILPALVHLEKGKILKEQEIILLTSEGIVVHHPDQSLVKTRHNLVFDMKNLKGPNKRGLYSYQYKGLDYFAVKEDLDNPDGWTLYLQVPARPLVVSIAKTIVMQLAEILLLFVAVSLAIQYVLNRFFSQPVTDIVRSLTEYVPGETSEVPAPKETVVKEFALISQAINDMAQDVYQSTERFRVLVDSLDALVYVADMDSFELLFINKYGKEIWGDIVGKICWKSLQKGQNGPCTFCTNHLLLDEKGNPKPTHVWEFQNTVSGRWYQCRDQAILWTGGRLVRMEIAIDITQRKEAEKALEAEKELLAVTLRSIADGVITTDIEGRVLFLNTVAENMTGWSQKEAEGRSLREVFHIVDDKTGELCDNPVDRVLATSRSVEQGSHTVLVAKNGVERTISDSGAPIRDKQSEIVGVVLVFRDETEKLHLEEESAKAKKLESVGVLAGGIAHDFNNILTAILGNLSLAMEDKSLSDKTKHLLESAEKASDRARNLTEQLLTFAKGGEPIKESTSIAHVIRDSASFVLHGSNVACDYDFPEDLWMVEIDQGQISQVIQNLIINAKDAMPDGGKVVVSCANVPVGTVDKTAMLNADSKYIKITIKDNGPGIPAELLGRIFDPYFTTKDQGSGLGLAICHSIIHKHGGSLLVTSPPGEGAVFTMYLPLATKPGIAQELPRGSIIGKTLPANVLVMDDDEMILNLAAQMLNYKGHEVFLARNGTEAIKIYQEKKDTPQAIDLVIMDLTIPGDMGGEEAIVEILAIDPDAKVVVSSGYSNDPIMANYAEYGFVAALIKPFDVKSFGQVVDEVLFREKI